VARGRVPASVAAPAGARVFLLGTVFLVFVLVPPLTSENPWESGAFVASAVFAVAGVVGVAIALFGSDRQVAKYLGGV
jgi:hypothetical protein